MTGTASTVFWRLADLANFTVQNETIANATIEWLTNVPQSLQPAITVLWTGILAARTRINLSLADITDEEQRALLNNANSTIHALRNISVGYGTDSDRTAVNSSMTLGAKVRLNYSAQAELALLRASENALSLLENLPQLNPLPQATCATGDVIFELPNCEVVVGGLASNTYSQNVSLLIDLGGSDEYRNNAGGASRFATVPRLAAILIDYGGSQDSYTSETTKGLAVQGAGCAGAGLLVDAGGNDTYSAQFHHRCPLDQALPLHGFHPDVMAQGQGSLGSGVLWDRCIVATECNDNHTSLGWSQGLGFTGFGLLLDEGGTDLRTVPFVYDGEGAQGVACNRGFGALIDRQFSPEDDAADRYEASVADMQGMACTEGLGVLVDQAGNDNYIVHVGQGSLVGQVVVQGGFSQGYAEVGAVGILLDLAGSDTYLLENLTGTNYEGIVGQGASINPAQAGSQLQSFGMLIDLSGNDVYTGAKGVQGWGGDRGHGYLEDRGGDDTYSANLRCQGSGGGFAGVPTPHGSGNFTDRGSAGDSYTCNEPATDCGQQQTPVVRGNNRRWCSGDFGMGSDYVDPP